MKEKHIEKFKNKIEMFQDSKFAFCSTKYANLSV